jgi:4-hydroxy-3-polyprenylbenzoate decarboxylase
MTPKRLTVGISGATGIVYGARILQCLRSLGIETRLVVSRAGEMTRTCETDLSRTSLRNLADFSYQNSEVGAAIASGSFRTQGMIIAPCSMRTLAEVATGVSSSLLTRAADVCLKERRRLALLVRETPLHAVHLRNMLAVTEMGGIICPPVPAFYGQPHTIEDIVDHTVGASP